MHPEVKRLAQDPTAGETQPGFGPRQLCPRALSLKARVPAQGPPHCLESKGRHHNPTSPGGAEVFFPKFVSLSPGVSTVPVVSLWDQSSASKLPAAHPPC